MDQAILNLYEYDIFPHLLHLHHVSQLDLLEPENGHFSILS